MIGFLCRARCGCLLLLTWSLNAAFGQYRYRVTGGGSCTNPTSRAAPRNVVGSMLQVKAVARTEKKVDAAVDIAPVATNATSGLEQQKGVFGKALQEAAPAGSNRTIAEANLSAAEQIEKAEADGLNGVQQGEGEGPPEKPPIGPPRPAGPDRKTPDHETTLATSGSFTDPF